MVGHQVRCKNTFLELDIPKADLRRLATCPGRVLDEVSNEKQRDGVKTPSPTLVARRGLPPLRHLDTVEDLILAMEDSVVGDRYDGDVDQDSTDEDLPLVVQKSFEAPAAPFKALAEPSRYQAHFAGLAGKTQRLDFRGLLSELRGLSKRGKEPQQEVPEPEPEAVPELSAPAPRTCWADIESSDDEEPLEEQKPQEAPRACWADIESSDDEELQKPEAPRRTCWADIESDDEAWTPLSASDSCGSERPEPTRAPTPPRVRPRLQSDESVEAKYRRRVVTWAQPLSGPAASAPAAFAPGTPTETETVSALAAVVEDDGWSTVQKKDRKAPAPASWADAARRGAAAPAQRAPARAPVRAAPVERRRTSTCTEKVFVNLEDGEFPVVRRLIGQGGANMRRITESCSAQVHVRGRGAGGVEPLHVLVSADPATMPRALAQVTALVEDVRAQFKRSAQRATRGN